VTRPQRRLIVNADDFGHSAPVNLGVVEAFERGIVTSTSLMVDGDAADDAVAYAREHPQLGVGLHLDLGEWEYRDGDGWLARREVLESDLEAEVRRQLDRFRLLVGRPPTHIDSHQHRHLRDTARTIVAAAGRELDAPVRRLDPRVRYCGDFYGQTATGEPLSHLITPEALIGALERLDPGVSELGCHPGRGPVPDSSYSAEREVELAALCAPSVAEAVARLGITLCSFADLV
jgi:predicted glycoside hydrolase/deacetylase ChbG (UPF0249 family)